MLAGIAALWMMVGLVSCNNRCDDLTVPPSETSEYVLPYPVGKTAVLFMTYCSRRGHENRLAYDFEMPMGAEVCCSRGGVVVEVQNDFHDDDHTTGHNNRVVVKHDDGSLAWYGHLQYKSAAVAVGDTVGQGQVIGLCGTSGRSGNVPHVHFEVFKRRKYDYGDAIPISFRNLKGPVDSRGVLIQHEEYTALAY